MTSLPWYIARSAGLMSWALLTASVLWGLALSTKILGRRPRSNWLLDLHRYLGGLAAIFAVVHVVGVLLDTFVPFGLVNVLVPFTSSWRPVAVAWGIAGLYLLAAVELTSLARSRLPKRVWRAVHFASFPLFLVATIHAFTAGTDAHTWAFEGCAVLAVSAVVGLTAARVAKDVGGLSSADGSPVRSRARPVRAPARVG